MNCPACKTTSLDLIQLDRNLPARACPSCHGNWLPAREYQRWLDAHGPPLAEKPYEGPPLEFSKDQHAKICPQCHCLMMRYQVGHGMQFSIDQCNGCLGIWFDRNEWEALKGRNLHDEVFSIFTAPWQSKAQKEETRMRLDAVYARRFGAEYPNVKRIWQWLHNHPERDRILAFFHDRDPYSQ